MRDYSGDTQKELTLRALGPPQNSEPFPEQTLSSIGIVSVGIKVEAYHITVSGRYGCTSIGDGRITETLIRELDWI